MNEQFPAIWENNIEIMKHKLKCATNYSLEYKNTEKRYIEFTFNNSSITTQKQEIPQLTNR